MTITNDSTALVRRDDELSLDEQINTDPTLREIVQSLGPVRQRFTKAAAEVVSMAAKPALIVAKTALIAASYVILPLYGPMAAFRDPKHAVADPGNIIAAEGLSMLLGGVVAIGVSGVLGGGIEVATAMGLPATETGSLISLMCFITPGPAIIGGATGLLTDFKAIADNLSGSTLVNRLGDIRVPVGRILGAGKPPQLKR